ncbi:cation:proton antiporter [Benzoatithermus flavus]|uniref:Cation:proton antiporter n=1 Tax=Benzoatithermus flavus TaxID=3108223 RepID=A0ABU8XYE2_9PROT
MSGTGGLVFGIAVLLALIALLPRFAARLRLPYTVLLAGLGCALGLGLSLSGSFGVFGDTPVVRDFFQQLRQFDVTAEVLLWVFLPILLFETATKLNGRELLDDLGPILILAVVAVLMTTAAAGAGLWLASTFPLTACLLVAAIIATTDPSAVTAVFKEVGARRRLTLLVEGESLLNDAAAIALFTTLLGLIGRRVQPDQIVVFSELARNLAVEFMGGALLGAALGRIAALVVARIDQGGPAEVTLSLALAYLAYALAEVYLHVSGVVAVVVAGLVFGTIGRMRVGAKEWQSVSAIWTQLGFWASSLVFVLASMLVPDTIMKARTSDFVLLAVLIVGALAARALCIFGVLPLVRILLKQRPIDARYKLVILWGGVRGAVTLALALAVTENPRVPAEIRHLVSVLATGFVLFTLLVQATTLRPLIRWLGVDQLDPVERILRTRALALAQGQILDRLSETAIVHGLDLEAAEEVGALYRKRVAALEDVPDMGEEMLGQQLRVALATITTREAALYADEMAEGTISRNAGSVLLGRTNDLLDAIKEGGVQSYRLAARRSTRIDRVMRIASFLHRHLRLQRPLARRMAQRIELRLIQRRVLENLIAFIRSRIRALFGERVSEVALHVVEARIEELDRALDAIRLQYPAYWHTVSGRFLSRTAVRLELDAYRRMADEGLLSPEIFRNLADELRSRLESFERIPPLDLGLNVDALISNVPMLGRLGEEARKELRRLLVPIMALPGERIVRRGERGDAMYFIASGAVEVQREEGTIRLGTGDFFGEMALIMRRPRTADVVALSYCRLLMLRRDAFRQFLRANPELMQQVRKSAEERLRVRPAEAPAAA